MKTPFYIIAVLLLLITGCNDSFLDVAPRDQVTNETFFVSQQDAIQAANSVYDYWGGQGNNEDGFGYSFFLYLADTWSDDAYIPLDGYWYQRFQNGALSPSDTDVLARWQELYFIIRRANWFLANISRPEMDQNLRLRLTAEVRFIRAFQYFLLCQTWGEVPIVKEPLTLSELKVPRAGVGETMSFILDELDFSISTLPSAYAQEDEGRITKGAAMALKARLLLYEGRWEESYGAAKEVMDLGLYSLFQTAEGDGYSELFDTENENNAEIILDRENAALPNHGNQLPRLSALKSSIGGDGFISPTQALIDAYHAYDPVDDQFVPIDPNNEFSLRDPRLGYTIAYPGSVFFGQVLSPTSPPLSNSRTRYGTIKFIPDGFNGNNGGLDYAVNHILIRYAEVLLTYAEAKIEANSIDQSVIDVINQVRSRAYGVSFMEYDKYPEVVMSDQNTLREVVRNERRVELALEGLRWFDIKRWRIGEAVLGMPIYGAKVSGQNVLVAEGGVFDPSRDYLRPIPEREIQLIGENILLQNPNY